VCFSFSRVVERRNLLNVFAAAATYRVTRCNFTLNGTVVSAISKNCRLAIFSRSCESKFSLNLEATKRLPIAKPLLNTNCGNSKSKTFSRERLECVNSDQMVCKCLSRLEF
jgi:hypothetical protein